MLEHTTREARPNWPSQRLPQQRIWHTLNSATALLMTLIQRNEPDVERSPPSIGSDTHHGPPASPRLSRDTNLNALVQLGTFRLNADRAFLSMLDGEFQYVVAEATREQPFLSCEVTESEPSLFLGVCKLALGYGLCPNTMQAFTTDTYTKDGPNITCNRDRFVINDLHAEPDYVDRPYVAGFPHMVSYLEVPLITPLGYVLGSYCVVDNVKRDFDNNKNVNAMKEISNAIMRHLDLVKTKVLRDRSEKMIIGLGHFMERDVAISNPYASASVTASVESTQRELSGVGGNLATPGSEIPDRRLSICSQLSQATWSDSGSSVTSTSDDQYTTSENPNTTFVPWTPRLTPSPIDEKAVLNPSSASSGPVRISSGQNEVKDKQSSASVPVSPPRSPCPTGGTLPSVAPPMPPSPATTPTSKTTHASPVSLEVRDTFAKAARTIREAIGMDSVTFLDAVPSGFASRVAVAHPAPQEDQLSMEAPEYFTEGIKEVYCATLSHSAKAQGPSHTQAPAPLQMSEAMLQRFIRRYPRGHIFTADALGPIDVHYGPGHALRTVQKSRGRTTRYREDIRKLFLHVPNARYVVLLPLWHFQKEVWFSAMVGYVIDPNFALSSQDINLLSSLGNSIMAQVSRLEALSVSRAKSDFVSSISHELRSPLHGIMASGELLRDTLKDPNCLPFLDMLDSCSTTLVDTFDNLLDFAKINTDARAMSNMDTALLKQQVEPELPLVDLSRLVEEVVEIVQLGHASKTGFHAEPEQTASMSEGVELPSNLAETLPDTAVLVTVKIEKRASWMTRVDVGAWKRIIMNLLGNSLKYTRSGHIEVGLSVIQKPGSKNPLRNHICFSVKDTGIGMSPDYIKYHLFTPFAQENILSPGAGLGLSIVQQLVKRLGGELDVKSLIGIGTQITALIPSKGGKSDPVALQLTPIDEESELDIHHDLAGHTLCCITWDAYRAISDEKRKSVSEVRDRSRVTRSILKQIAIERLGMNVVFSTKSDPLPAADVYYFDSYILGQPMHTRSKTQTPAALLSATPLIMLCSGCGPLQVSKEEEAASKVVHMRHPIAPRKLSTALLRALEVGKPGQTAFKAAPVLLTQVVDSYFPALLEEKKSALVTVQEVSPSMSLHLSPSRSSPPIIASPLPSTPLPGSTSEEQPSTTTMPQAALHLLLVDDNPINLKILTTLVKKLSFTFATACNGLEAVHQFSASLHPSKRLFDVIFMDISMPVMNGFEATREIRQIEKDNSMDSTDKDIDGTHGFGCQIVALTGLGSEESRQDAFSSGTNLFMTKPVKMGQIKQLLEAAEERVRRRGGRGSNAGPVPSQALVEGSQWGKSNTSSVVTQVSSAPLAGGRGSNC